MRRLLFVEWLEGVCRFVLFLFYIGVHLHKDSFSLAVEQAGEVDETDAYLLVAFACMAHLLRLATTLFPIVHTHLHLGVHHLVAVVVAVAVAVVVVEVVVTVVSVVSVVSVAAVAAFGDGDASHRAITSLSLSTCLSTRKC